MIDHQLLAETELFARLRPDQLDRLVDAATTQSLGRGDVLFDAGDDSGDLYIVATGRIGIANRSFDGRESMVALMEPGDLFGEMPLFDGLGRSAQARALEASQVVAVPYRTVRSLYEAEPTLLWSVVRMLVRRLRATDEALADSVFLDVTGRTAKRLLELARTDDEFSLPITQEELAGMIGASRERVNKVIASFIRLRWIEQQDRRYRILDRANLENRSR